MLVVEDRHAEEMGRHALAHARPRRLLRHSYTQGVTVSTHEEHWVSAIAQVQSDLEAEVVADAAEILVAEQARTTLGDRLRTGAIATITLSTGAAIHGLVLEHVEGFVDVLDGAAHAHLINLDQVDALTGLSGSLGPQTSGTIVSRWSTIVRALEGEAVLVELRSGRQLRGHIGAVGADHLDLLVDGQPITIGIRAVTRLSRPHRTGAC